MNKELDEEERQKILDAVSKFLNRENLSANRIVTYPHTPSIDMDSIGDTNPNDIVHLYFADTPYFINGKFERKPCLAADYWKETKILWNSYWLPVKQFPEAYKMFFDKYEQLDGDKIPKEEIEKYRKEFEMWWGKRKGEEQEQQKQAEHQDYYINEFYKFIKQDDLVAGFENETKFIMSSDKNLSNSKIKEICLDNNELIAYFENYMFTFKDNYSLYDDFFFKFNELLNKQKGEVEKLAELDVKDKIRKIEENTTRKSYADFLNETFNQPTQDTTDYSIKYDQNKHKLSQFPREAMEAVVEVMEYGARKYGKGSWNRVEAQRYVDAAARHLYAMQDIDENGRECINLSKKDDESDLEHLYHLACNVVYAVAIYRREKNEKGLYVTDPQKDLTFLTEDNIDKYVDDIYRENKNETR